MPTPRTRPPPPTTGSTAHRHNHDVGIMGQARLVAGGGERAVRRPPVPLQHPPYCSPRTAAASSKPRWAAMRYTVTPAPAKAHNQARRPPTRQPVSSGATTGLALTPSTSAA